MLTVIHTFNGLASERIIGEVQRGIKFLEDIEVFKFGSISQKNSDDVMLFSKWEDQSAFDSWAGTVGENKAFRPIFRCNYNECAKK